MVLGEFEYADMEKRFDEAGDKVSYFFTMVLLLAMILFGTITMINLFVGVVVSDVGKLKEETFLEVEKTTHLLKIFNQSFRNGD